MPDLPLERKSKKAIMQPSVAEQATPDKIKVTPENAAVLSVHFLSQIHGRLGYIIKLLEEKK